PAGLLLVGQGQWARGVGLDPRLPPAAVGRGPVAVVDASDDVLPLIDRGRRLIQAVPGHGQEAPAWFARRGEAVVQLELAALALAAGLPPERKRPDARAAGARLGVGVEFEQRYRVLACEDAGGRVEALVRVPADEVVLGGVDVPDTIPPAR